MENDVQDATPKTRFRGSLLAAWVIGPFLLFQTVGLGVLAVFSWLCSDWASFSKLFPVSMSSVSTFVSALPQAKFPTFQREVMAACSAGLGGVVFMIREFYLNFAYGKRRLAQPRLFLQASEIPRYVLLPVSSFILGPVGLALLQAGALVFSGFSAERAIPSFTIVTVCFLLGFSYHDTLDALRDRSRKLWNSSSPEEPTAKK